MTVAAAVVAAVLAAGTGGAVAGRLVTSAQIKDNTVASVDLKDGSATGADVKNGSLTGADVKNGSLTGADVAGGVGTVRYRFDNTGSETNTRAISMTLPAGSYVLTGSMWASTANNAATSAIVVCQFVAPTAASLPGGDGSAVFSTHASQSSAIGYGRTMSSVPVTLEDDGLVTWSCSKYEGANVSLYQARLQAVPAGGVVVSTAP